MIYEFGPNSPQGVLDLSPGTPVHLVIMIYKFVPNSPQGVLDLSPGTSASYSGTPGNYDIRICSQITTTCARFDSGNSSCYMSLFPAVLILSPGTTTSSTSIPGHHDLAGEKNRRLYIKANI